MSQVQVALCAAVCLCLLPGGTAQPTACRLDANCPVGFYCEPDLLFCRECLRCEDLKRKPPPSLTSCIKSVAECGPCDKGLVEDHRGDVNAQCLPKSERDVGDGFPLYGWVLVAVLCVLVLVLIGGILWYVLKHPDTLKILASTSTSMQSRCERSVVPATAPEHPPPYNALYTAVQPSPPSPPLPHSPLPPAASTLANSETDYQPHDEESSLPFIKRAASGRTWEARESRESAGRQAARVFNNPAYVRGAQPPPGYDTAVMKSVKDPEVTDQDEDTMESTWTPSENTDQNDNSNGAAAGSDGEGSQLPALLAAARGTALVRSHYDLTRQDPNNNGSRSNGEPSFVCGEGGSGSNNAPGGSSFIINVVQTINTVKQRGDIGH
ncbi:unnamed protein product [Parnassius apollo]|uniref:(apollo) hypothetical protein n=1 Tax=Parnassius apollo TaxID=110799 RepID=A0A8S3X8G5_PARAO|nr:unnamed protein product [Parnassius apollo]